MTTLKDDFTYRDFSGKRRPRHFVVAALLILAALAIIGLAAAAVNANRQASFNARMTELAGIPPTLSIPTPTPTTPPTATPVPSPTVDPCTYDTSYWSLTPIQGPTLSGQQNLYRLPACAYEGLKKAVAFYILNVNGWTIPELYQALGFDFGLPYPFAGSAIVSTEFERGVLVEPRFSPYPYSRDWTFDPETRKYESRFVLGGCYKDVPVRIFPGRRDITYPYGCTIVEFLPRTVSNIVVLEPPDGERLAGWSRQSNPNKFLQPYIDLNAPGFKIEHYVIYVGNGNWMYLGCNLRNYQAYETRELFDINFEVFRWREPNLPVMDLDWIKAEFGLEPRPVDWSILDMPEEVSKQNWRKMIEIKNAYFLIHTFEITPTPKPQEEGT